MYYETSHLFGGGGGWGVERIWNTESLLSDPNSIWQRDPDVLVNADTCLLHKNGASGHFLFQILVKSAIFCVPGGRWGGR